MIEIVNRCVRLILRFSYHKFYNWLPIEVLMITICQTIKLTTLMIVSLGQKGLDLDMAMAYWNIVLKGRFRFLDVWNRFLKVSSKTISQSVKQKAWEKGDFIISLKLQSIFFVVEKAGNYCVNY